MRALNEPQQAIAKAIRHKGRRIEHVCLESGNLSQWLYEGLVSEGFSISVMEARHVRAALRNFGLKMGTVTRKTWAPRARELPDGNELLEGIVDAMLRVRTLLLEELAKIDGQLTALAKSDPVTRLVMTTPGVGVVVALSFRSAVDDPDRFPRSRDVGAWLGLTPRRWQSGKTDIVGRITKAGDPRVRTMLFEAAASILGRVRAMSPLKAWGLCIAQRTSMKKAIVAVSRKLATILLAMWKSGTAYWASSQPPGCASDLEAA